MVDRSGNSNMLLLVNCYYVNAHAPSLFQIAMFSGTPARRPSAPSFHHLSADTGKGELAAVGTGNPIDTDSFASKTRRAYRGRSTAIVRPGAAGTAPAAGTITVEARAPGLVGATLIMHVVAAP